MTPQMWIDLSFYIVAGLFWVLFLAGDVAGVLGVMQMQADIKRREHTERDQKDVDYLMEKVELRDQRQKYQRKDDP